MVAIGPVAIGLFLIAVSGYIYLAPGLTHLRNYWLLRLYPGVVFAGFPAGVACICLAVLFSSQLSGRLFETAFVLSIAVGLSSLVFFYWSPRWARPKWMRD